MTPQQESTAALNHKGIGLPRRETSMEKSKTKPAPKSAGRISSSSREEVKTPRSLSQSSSIKAETINVVPPKSAQYSIPVRSNTDGSNTHRSSSSQASTTSRVHFISNPGNRTPRGTQVMVCMSSNDNHVNIPLHHPGHPIYPHLQHPNRGLSSELSASKILDRLHPKLRTSPLGAPARFYTTHARKPRTPRHLRSASSPRSASGQYIFENSTFDNSFALSKLSRYCSIIAMPFSNQSRDCRRKNATSAALEQQHTRHTVLASKVGRISK